MSTKPNLGNIFDSIFKQPWLNVVHGAETLFSEEAKNLQTVAESKIAAARQAAAEALDAHQAALQASVATGVDGVIEAIASKVPVVGQLVAGAAVPAVNEWDAAVLHAAFQKVEALLSPNPAGAGSTLGEPPV